MVMKMKNEKLKMKVISVVMQVVCKGFSRGLRPDPELSATEWADEYQMHKNPDGGPSKSGQETNEQSQKGVNRSLDDG